MLSHNHCMKNLIFKLTLAFLVVFSANFSLAQHSKKEKEIEHLITKVRGLHLNFKTKEMLVVTQKIINESEKIHYKKGLAYGNFYLAYSFFHVGRYKESVKYVEKSQSYTDYLSTDPNQVAFNYFLLGYNFLNLELYSLSIKNLHKALQNVNKVKNKDENWLVNKSIYYGTLSLVHQELNNHDSVYYYLRKEKHHLDKIVHIKDIYIEKNPSYLALGEYFLRTKKIDSAAYYYVKAYDSIKHKNHPFIIQTLMKLGDLEDEQKRYGESIDYYLKALENSKKYDYQFELSSIYAGLSIAYGKTGNARKENEYKKLQKKLEDSLNLVQKYDRDFVVSKVLQAEKEREQQKSKEKITGVSLIIGFVVLLLIGIFYYFNRRSKVLIKEKEIIIQDREEETLELKQKVNESFSEIVQLAKTNSPEFLTRFQEVYPNFIEKLKEISPEISSDDLRFCALLKLNFSTKDIAEYTFVTIRTVQTRKSRLRKKFNIPSNDDIYLWINKW